MVKRKTQSSGKKQAKRRYVSRTRLAVSDQRQAIIDRCAALVSKPVTRVNLPSPYSRYTFSNRGQLCDGDARVQRTLDKGFLWVRVQNDIGAWEERKLHELIAEVGLQTWTKAESPLSGYSYSNDGHLRRDAYTDSMGRDKPDRVLRMHKRGAYLGCSIYFDDHPKCDKTLTEVHIVIALAAHGARPASYYDVAHLDDDPFNASPENVPYQLQHENLRQARRKQGYPIRGWTEENENGLVFQSYIDAARFVGQSASWKVRRCCNDGRTLEFNGQAWRFERLGQPIKPKSIQQPSPRDREGDWKASDTFSQYQGTPDGLVRKTKTGMLLTQIRHQSGYVQVDLGGLVLLHEFIADIYLPRDPSNPIKNEQIDHIDGDKSHNCCSNLQRISGKSNSKKASGRPCQRCRDGKWETFPTQIDAAVQVATELGQCTAKKIHSLKNGISRVIRGGDTKRCAKYRWRALERGPNETYTCVTCGQEKSRPGPWIEALDH